MSWRRRRWTSIFRLRREKRCPEWRQVREDERRCSQSRDSRAGEERLGYSAKTLQEAGGAYRVGCGGRQRAGGARKPSRDSGAARTRAIPQMLADRDVEMVVIATPRPSTRRAERSRRCRQGSMVCEKPMALTKRRCGSDDRRSIARSACSRVFQNMRLFRRFPESARGDSVGHARW